jgi:hypothetical protein
MSAQYKLPFPTLHADFLLPSPIEHPATYEKPVAAGPLRGSILVNIESIR